MAKVIHVFLTKPLDNTKRRDWYFSSITAIYTVFTPEQVGATKKLPAPCRAIGQRYSYH